MDNDARTMDRRRQQTLAAYGLPHTVELHGEYLDAPGRTIGDGTRPGTAPGWPAGSLEALRHLPSTAAKACGVPYAVLNIITDREQHQLASHGFDARVCSVEDSMCAAVFRDGQTTVVPDATLDPRFAQNPFVTGELGHLRFYASAPLVAHGIPLGSLCVFSTEPGTLSPPQVEVLESIAGNVVDLLDLHLRTRELDATVAALQASNDRLAGFAGRISHDLRTPLTSVLGYLELASDMPARAEHYLQVAGSAGQRMLQTLDDVLGFSRIGGRIHPVDVPLADLVEAVQADLAHDLDRRHAIMDTIPATVHGDPAQLRALVQNLVANAVLHCPPNRIPHIGISPVAEPGASGLTVSDNGDGIPAEEWDHVLQPLVRLAEDDTVPGSGLGLPTCAGVAAAHGGTLELESSAAGGASITARWPVHRPGGSAGLD